MSHLSEVPLITQFLATAPITPMAIGKDQKIRIGASSVKKLNLEKLERLGSCRNVAREQQVIFFFFENIWEHFNVNVALFLKEASEEDCESDEKTNDNQNDVEKSGAELAEPAEPVESKNKWLQYTCGGLPSYDDLVAGKCVSEFKLEINFDQKIIVENPLNGALLMDR